MRCYFQNEQAMLTKEWKKTITFTFLFRTHLEMQRVCLKKKRMIGPIGRFPIFLGSRNRKAISRPSRPRPPPSLSLSHGACAEPRLLRLSLWQVGDRVFAACPLSRLSEQGASAFSTRFDRRTWQARGRDGVFIFLPTAYDRGTDCEGILGSKMLISDSFALEEIDKKIYFLS